ncbi:MAG: peptidylprolyl isomerase [Gammaproteobacteria bacterium]|nr:peptidylprolyl isomerase [Gammaproteobacteria bacterium]
MPIDKDSVVSFHYRLRVDGEQVEDSHEGEPLAYLHGHGNIIPGLESAMAGKEAGENFSTTIAPEMAYGPRREDAVARVQMKHVLTKGRLAPGQPIMVNTEHGPRQVRVLKPGKFVVDVDANHPMAGATLNFDIEIVEVRAASAEELAHGHVHGAGGHHH